MAKKKDRAFFTCPRWNEIADGLGRDASGERTTLPIHPRTLAALQGGRPLARSTLRHALLAARRSGGKLFEVEQYITDQRVSGPR